MRQRSAYSISTFFVVAVAVFSFTAYAAIPDPSSDIVSRWDHLALTHNDANVGSDGELSSRIVRLGDDGWELVNVSTIAKDGTTVKTVFYFKRPK